MGNKSSLRQDSLTLHKKMKKSLIENFIFCAVKENVITLTPPPPNHLKKHNIQPKLTFKSGLATYELATQVASHELQKQPPEVFYKKSCS